MTMGFGYLKKGQTEHTAIDQDTSPSDKVVKTLTAIEGNSEQPRQDHREEVGRACQVNQIKAKMTNTRESSRNG